MSDCRLYVISPPRIGDVDGFARDLDAVLGASNAAAFQLRLKGLADPETGEEPVADAAVWRAVAPQLLDVCRAHGAAFIVNDSIDFAAEFGADGVHLGQSDGAVKDARARLGDGAVIGVTCHASRHLAMQAGEAGADYVAFGAFYPTDTKTTHHRAEPEILTWWTEVFELPALAIGGVSVDNVQHLVRAGADFVAVSSGIWGHDSGPEAAARAFAKALTCE